MSLSPTGPSAFHPPQAWHRLARAVWWVLAGYPILLFVVGLALEYGEMRQPCDPLHCTTASIYTLTPTQALEWQAAGLSLDLYAAVVVAVKLYLGVVSIACALLIFLRGPDERMAYVVSLALVVLGAFLTPGVSGMVIEVIPELRPLVLLTYLWGNAIFPALLFLLPDGQFVPRWSRWFFILFVGSFSAAVLLETVSLPTTVRDATQTLATVVITLCALVGLFGQVYRYSRAATSVVRKQILWIALGVISTGVTIPISALLSGGPVADPANEIAPQVKLLSLVISLMGVSGIPVSLAVAILRYRLWDIDLIIRRTLIYASLTALLALIYLLCVVGLQAVVGGLAGGRQPALVTVISTLTIAALFGPLRRRVQAAVDRRFFRRKYDAAQLLAAFGHSLRDETDLSRLSDRLVDMTVRAMQPSTAGLWLRLSDPPPAPPGASRPPDAGRPTPV